MYSTNFNAIVTLEDITTTGFGCTTIRLKERNCFDGDVDNIVDLTVNKNVEAEQLGKQPEHHQEEEDDPESEVSIET